MYVNLLPPEFLIILEIFALLGYFIFAGLVVSYGWRGFKFFLRENASKYRWIFFVLNAPLLVLFIFLFKLFFLKPAY